MGIQELLFYLKVLKKRWWLILLLIVSTVGSILAVFYTAKPVYRSSLKFLFSSPPIAELSVYGDFRNPSIREEISYARANFIEILGNPSTIWRAIETLDQDLSVDDIKVIVEPSETSEIVRLTVEMEEPQLAADMANALMDVALETYGELRARPTTMSHAFISAQLDAAYAKWKQAQEALTEFRIENGISDLDSALEQRQSLVRSLMLERDEALVKENLELAAKYDGVIAQHEVELQNLAWLSSQYAELETTVRQTRELYDLLLSKETEAAIKENEILSGGFVSVLGPARPSKQPISAFNSKVVLLGAIVSLAVGVLLSVAWEYLERQGVFGASGERVAAERYQPQEGLP